MATTLTFTLVRGSDGTVDKEASLVSCEAAIDQYKAARELELGAISDAVHGIFDKYKSATLTMPFVCGESCRVLNAQPANFKLLQEKVATFVRENSQGKKIGEGESATWERPDSTFVITKGKGGGVIRREDVAAPDAEAASAE